MNGTDAGDDADLHTRLTRSTIGRCIVGLVIGVGSFWVVAPNLPPSPVRADLAVLWRPADEIGLVQDWSVFSPNPRNETIDVRARAEYDDGSFEMWDVPDFDPVVGAFRQYRWHKWQERIRLDSQGALWPTTAEWIAVQRLRDGVRPARVVLVRRWIVHEPLTASGWVENSGWFEFEFYVWERDA